MLSYQHSFHAGNHADVIKHVSVIAILEKLYKKPKAFFFLDTHAGNGLYDINEQAIHDKVIAKELLTNNTDLEKLPSCLALYQQIIATYVDKKMYPGSPLIVEDCCNMFDKALFQSAPDAILPSHNMHVNELHPTAFEDLHENTKNTRFQRHHRDGFELLNALMPPRPNRGMVLIDPPYEQAQEYKDVVSALKKSLSKWPQGTFAIWYPLLSPTRIDRNSQREQENPKHGLAEQMLVELSTIASRGLLDIQFAYQQPSKETGMYGSGMAIINPPWQLDTSLQGVIDYMSTHYQYETNQLSHVKFLVPLA